MKTSRKDLLLIGFAIVVMLAQTSISSGCQNGDVLLPTGMEITPSAAKGSEFQSLNPGLANLPDFEAGQAVTTATSPDGDTLLILTSGYNRNDDSNGKGISTESNEYVFVYDISQNPPIKQQVIQVPNTFNGIAWNPNGTEFYVSGGVDDNVHVFDFTKSSGLWTEVTVNAPISLGHKAGNGLSNTPMAAGVGVNAKGDHLVVANMGNDSASLIDLTTRKVTELDLRPGKTIPSESGVAGGEYPFWVVVKGNEKAYISSERDREIVVLSIEKGLSIVGRIPVEGSPNKMIFNKAEDRLYVALANSDTVAVIDTSTNNVIDTISTIAPREVFSNAAHYKGSNPNSLALSPDESRLFVTNGGTNSLAVIQLSGGKDKDDDRKHGENESGRNQVIGLIPTGWYPNSVSLNRKGTELYVVNGKSNAGPNPAGCRDTTSIASGSLNKCSGSNEYVWQLTKAGFLTLPMPNDKELSRLTWQVAANDHFPSVTDHRRNEKILKNLRHKIHHVIYVVKENRTYDQVLGDLEKGNGDPALNIFPEALSPNHHQLARQFVALDNFYDSGEVSGDGWNWTTAASTTDFTEKTVAVNYAGRGGTYDWEGTNWNINVGYATVAARVAANPLNPTDPDLLPGAVDVAAPDGPDGEVGTGYLWDAAIRAGLTLREYGFFLDLVRYSGNATTNPAYIPISHQPFTDGIVQAYPTKATLQANADVYFRGFDMNNADFWNFKEWEREFDGYVAGHNLPGLTLLRFPHDHFGSFSTAKDGVNTVETQFADNDYAIGQLAEKISNSIYKDDTIICVLEDDAQNGPDHVDAHRSIAYLIGPYVKQGAVVSKHYTTVNMIRTMEDLLGIEPMGLNDGLSEPMADAFDLKQANWNYTAIVPKVLRTTQLPLPAATAKNSLPSEKEMVVYATPLHDAAYWESKMKGQDFSVEDHLNVELFNRVLWEGLKGADVPYPTKRDGLDLSHDRKHLLEEAGKFMQEKKASLYSFSQNLM